MSDRWTGFGRRRGIVPIQTCMGPGFVVAMLVAVGIGFVVRPLLRLVVVVQPGGCCLP